MENTFISIGTIANTHGIRGEMKLQTRGIDARFLTGCKTFYLDGKPYAASGLRIHKGCLLLTLHGIADMDAALALKNTPVSLRRTDVSLPQGVYFDQELIGLTAYDAETGDILGTVEEVTEYPAHKVYTVRGGKDEYLIPAVPAFVKSISLIENKMDIHVWKGMGSHED